MPQQRSKWSDIAALMTLILFCAFSGSVTDSVEERDALVDFYNALQGANWTDNSGWLTNASYCDWFGLFCSTTGVVYEISLVQNNLKGVIPFDALSKLQALIAISLGGNQIHGTVGTEIGLLSHLKVLSLDSNAITGPLPSQLNQLLSVKSLFMDFNDLSGPLLPDIFPRNVQILGLAANQYSGELTDAFMASLPSLQDLFLNLNSLSGTLPSQTSTWSPSLEVIAVGGNDLIGSIPESWSQLSNLKVLILKQNELNGTLSPTVLRSWPLLERVDIGDNDISGELPSALGDLSSLRTFFAKSNALNGTIPSAWSSLEKLEVLALSDNLISGDIIDVAKIGLHISQVLDVSKNNLTGTMEDVLAVAGAVGSAQLDVSSNPGLHGTFPLTLAGALLEFNDIFEINILFSLNVANCNFSGTLPGELFRSSLVGLAFLDISNNNFSGPLPSDYLTNSSSLQSFYVSDNPNLRQEGDLGRLTFSQTEVKSYLNFSCPAVDIQEIDADDGSKRRILVIGIEPEYFDFEDCVCDQGFTGTPPLCEVDNSRTIALAVALPVVAVLIAVGTTWVLYARRRHQRRKREKTADFLLRAYAAHQAQTFGESTSGNGVSAPKAVLNPLAVATALQRVNEMDTAGSQQTKSSNGLSSDSSRQSVPAGLSRLFTADSDWIIPFSKVQILRQLATGASGTVSLGVWNHTQVAVKLYHPGMTFDMGDFIAETAVHLKLRHPNIVQLMGICVDPVAVVLEFMSRGSLYHILKADATVLRTPGLTRKIALHMARGMAFLHSKGIIHRDLKSLNVLVAENWVSKVSDFGASRQQSHQSMTAGLGTVRWMAPETMSSGRYTTQCDIYSFALVLWEMVASGRTPYEEVKFDFEVMDRVKEGYRPSIPSECDPGWAALIQRCWDQDASQRPNFEEIVAQVNAFSVDMFGNAVDESVV